MQKLRERWTAREANVKTLCKIENLQRKKKQEKKETDYVLKMQAAEIEVNARIEAADKVADDYFDECESSTGPLLLNAVVTPVVEIAHVHGATNNNVIPPN